MLRLVSAREKIIYPVNLFRWINLSDNRMNGISVICFGSFNRPGVAEDALHLLL